MNTTLSPVQTHPTAPMTSGEALNDEVIATASVRSSEARQELLRDGTYVLVRPIQPDDLEQERRFITGLSPRVRRFRFLETMNTPSPQLLRQLTVVDAAHGVAYVAVINSGPQEEQIGVARFSAVDSAPDCEFAVTVSDAWQRKGLGTLLMRRLLEAARARGIDTLHSSDSADNDLMRNFAAHLHLHSQTDPQDPTLVLYNLNVKKSALLDSPAPHRADLAPML